MVDISYGNKLPSYKTLEKQLNEDQAIIEAIMDILNDRKDYRKGELEFKLRNPIVKAVYDLKNKA